MVDDADYERVSQYKWHAHRDMTTPDIFRACRHVPLGGSKTIELSVELMGKRPGFIIDHKNRNSLDCRRGNLRWATLQQNCRNRIRGNQFNAPGVFRNGAGFSSRITIAKGRRLFLGYFKTLNDAARAYREACNRYFGEFSPYVHV